MLYMHAYTLIIGTHFSCGRGPAGPWFVLGSSVLRYTQSVSYVLATKIIEHAYSIFVIYRPIIDKFPKYHFTTTIVYGLLDSP